MSEQSSVPPSGPSLQDEALLRRVAVVLIEVAQLLPHEERLRNMFVDENHPAMQDPATQDQELAGILSKARREQLGGIINLLAISVHGHRELVEYMRRTNPEKKAAVSEAMKRLGIEE